MMCYFILHIHEHFERGIKNKFFFNGNVNILVLNECILFKSITWFTWFYYYKIIFDSLLIYSIIL